MTTQDGDDGSRIEAAEAGVHAEERELAGHGPATVHDADSHAAHLGHGEADDPNAGVVVGTPPTPAWVMTAAGIGVVTIIVTVILAVMLHNADSDREGGGTPAHGRAAMTLTVAGS
jgi:hypothetical protein